MIFLALSLVILAYAATIAQLIYGYRKVRVHRLDESTPHTFFAIVVPFRNEALHLPQLLESFKNIDYPANLFEIILVDDFSEDQSVRLIYDWRMANGTFQTTLLENIKISGAPKKDAIARAIPIIKNDWLITTDADCVVPPTWLRILDQYIRKHKVSMIAGAVSLTDANGFLRHFQQSDLAALQGATIGSFGLGLGFMCNGANFCYTKSLFHSVGGFSGNDNMASGDDVFLLQKAVAAFPEEVHYLKSESHIVLTQPEATWKSLFHQRVRWASKTRSYQSVFAKDLAVLVFAGNLAWIAALLCFGFGVIGVPETIALIGVKFAVDTVLICKCELFLTGKRPRFLIISSLLYPFFSVAVALYSLFGKYEWKGRTF